MDIVVIDKDKLLTTYRTANDEQKEILKKLYGKNIFPRDGWSIRMRGVIGERKPKFDPKTLQPFDKVLVKTGTKSYHVWFPDFISLPPNDIDKTVLCMTIDDVVMAIPYNEDTKHLAGTNKEAPEFYRYWEN